MMSFKTPLASCIAVAAIAILLPRLMMRRGHHAAEDGLLTDWSRPPPRPIFVGVNLLIHVLQSIIDVLKPPPTQMAEAIFGYQNTMLVYIVQKYDIADFLAAGPKTCSEIAGHMQMDDAEDRVERLMYALASNGWVRLVDGDKFVNTAVSALLRTDHPHSMKGYVGHLVDDTFAVWQHLPRMYGPNAIDNAWDPVFPEFPRHQNGIWKYYEANPHLEEQFGRAMEGIESLGGKAMAADGPFARFDRYIDVGGSLGHFLYKYVLWTCGVRRLFTHYNT